jgi:RNA-directed DNA polymerase
MSAHKAGALKDDIVKWNSIDWKEAEQQVRRLQVRIAKAVKDNRWNKVIVLQHLLTHSFYAKLLAVKRVTSNKGKNTPGVDGVLWKDARAKGLAACSLNLVWLVCGQAKLITWFLWVNIEKSCPISA